MVRACWARPARLKEGRPADELAAFLAGSSRKIFLLRARVLRKNVLKDCTRIQYDEKHALLLLSGPSSPAPPPGSYPHPTDSAPSTRRVFIVVLVRTHPLWNRLTTLSVSGLTSSCGGANDSGTRCVPYVLIGAFRSTDRGSISSLRCRNTCESACE